jgi:hypothetical protein
MSNIKLVHSGGNSVSLTTPDSNPAANRTFKLPGNADGTILSSTSGSSIQVLEQFYTPCDGSTIATAKGNITVENVTQFQNMTTTFTDITGSTLTYQPPDGTTQVIYEFGCNISGNGAGSSNSIFSSQIVLNGNAILHSGITDRLGASYADSYRTIKFGINIGGSTSTDTGRLASWNSGIVVKVQGAEYGSSNQSRAHCLLNFGNSSPLRFNMPQVGITAIGVPS